MPDYTGGYSGAVNQLSEMQSRGVVDAMRRQALDQEQQALAAKAAWGPILARLMQGGAGPAQQPGIPPMPGTPAGGPQPPPPGAASVPAMSTPQPMMGGAPGGPIPPMAAGGPAAASGGAPGVPTAVGAPAPFRPMPSEPAAPAGGPAPGGAIPPPPPGMPPTMAAPDASQQFALPNILKQLQAAGVPPERWGTMLDNLPEPVKNNAAQQIKMMEAQNRALRDWATTQYHEGLLRDRERQTDIREADERRKKEQGEERLRQNQQKMDLLRAKAQAAAGGAPNLKSVEFIYPKGADGKPDETQAPIGTRGVTKTGKIIMLDAEGNQTTPGALGGATAKEGKDAAAKDKAAGGGKGSAVRESIVRSGVTNSLARLDEIEKKFGDTTTTSMFFGQHGDNPITRGAYGIARGQQSGPQQEADAKWASFIDEAIPVFTGGLRGSDAFRRFLIEQAPAPGDKPATVAEKRRLFRENINGTSKAFFSKFKSDPAMWAPGTDPNEVKSAGAPAAGGAAPAANQGGWKVEKVGGGG